MSYKNLRVIGLREQLQWHRQVDGDKEIPKAISMLKKADLWKEVLAAVERRAQKNTPGGMSFVFRVAITCLTGDLIDQVLDIGQPTSHDPMAVDPPANVVVILDITTIDDALATPIGSNRPLSEAGCVWSANDYSCAYDAVFMVSFSTYRSSSLLWQECWKAESAINKFLVEQFNRIFEGFASDLDFFALSARFSECRDNFRDWMFAVDRVKFPRRGTRLASVSNILQYFTAQHNHSADLEHTRLCSNAACPPTIFTMAFSAMCHASGDPHNAISVQSVVTQRIASLFGQPLISRCGGCSGRQVQSTWSMAALTWVWFEIFVNSHVSPSFTLTFDQFGEPRKFTLAAVVYFGGVHFTARWRDHLGVWWKCDGREHYGSPVIDVISTESDLLQCDGRRMSFLIYSFEHDT